MLKLGPAMRERIVEMRPISNEAGVLAPRAAQGRYSLTREPPPSDLADLIERTWIVHWDLRGQPPHSQATLPTLA